MSNHIETKKEYLLLLSKRIKGSRNGLDYVLECLYNPDQEIAPGIKSKSVPYSFSVYSLEDSSEENLEKTMPNSGKAVAEMHLRHFPHAPSSYSSVEIDRIDVYYREHQGQGLAKAMAKAFYETFSKGTKAVARVQGSKDRLERIINIFTSAGFRKTGTEDYREERNFLAFNIIKD